MSPTLIHRSRHPGQPARAERERTEIPRICAGLEHAEYTCIERIGCLRLMAAGWVAGADGS